VGGDDLFLTLSSSSVTRFLTIEDQLSGVPRIEILQEYDINRSWTFMTEKDGTAGNDAMLFALSGSGLVFGGAGNDLLLGGGSADSLSGGDGDDILIGSAGSDTLFGGAGIDRFIGGDGADRFVIDYRASAVEVAINNVQGIVVSEIVDFSVGGDTLTIFDSAGVLAVGQPANITTIVGRYDGTNAGNASGFIRDADGILYFDSNGSADGYTFIAKVTGSVSASQIEVVHTSPI
jgi:Ca2+-binding RTX toxin-like protein